MTDDLKDLAVKQFIMEDYFRQFGIITPDYLQKIRMMLIIGFDLKQVDIECDLHNFKIKVGIKFKWIHFYKSKKKLLSKIHTLIQNNLIQYDISTYIIGGNNE